MAGLIMAATPGQPFARAVLIPMPDQYQLPGSFATGIVLNTYAHAARAYRIPESADAVSMITALTELGEHLYEHHDAGRLVTGQYLPLLQLQHPDLIASAAGH
ncbi:MAG: hypothetical protein TR69_WS6001000740 [candidate division WS6 bacterium OLB20]|uniref:Uncharacterized protein n=1 Tax=candidate division WS6 bacterium OLB20 TaxID=1617426 RepID=A0A136LYN7_9BACT|nr:MAG: hypothetical protein TR69_WS6001000740 [candidate division WS6 bacterium OLB20]